MQPLVDALGSVARIVWLEDVAASATTSDKVWRALLAGRPLALRKPDDAAVVLFTSGSEGAPKGVALSHKNLLANVAQLDARFDLTLADMMFNPLPIFHAFGLTGGLLLGLMRSMRVFLYPTPLHYRQIPELVYGYDATVLVRHRHVPRGLCADGQPLRFPFAALCHCGRRAGEGRDAQNLYGEVRPAHPRGLWRDRVLAGGGGQHGDVQQGRNRRASFCPSSSRRLEPVPGIEDGGRLHVRGPNVMLGYYRPDNPGEVETLAGGWYDTGDIVAIDAEGYVAIKGRAKRFAKIAGEMVSLAAVEDLLAGLWPENKKAAVAAPDARKGERIVLATDKRDVSRAEVVAWLKAKGAADLMIPASVVTLDAIPLLGSGKTDNVALAKRVREWQE